MGSSTEIKILHRYTVAPPPETVPSTTLPLTFFDIPWLLFTPNQPLFFYDFPTSTSHFTKSVLPNVMHSLSLTLEHFFPFAGKLVTPSLSATPFIKYSDNDSVSLTIAEASPESFSYLTGYQPRNCQDFHQLVPALASESPPNDYKCVKKQPVFAIQITLFPDCGISIGFTLRQVVSDGRTFNNFLKTWALLSVVEKSQASLHKLSACNDRLVIQDPCGLHSELLHEWLNLNIEKPENLKNHVTCSSTVNDDMVRATFVLSRQEMEKIKEWILTRSKKLYGSSQMILSPYVLTCAFLWVCWMKTKYKLFGEVFGNQIHYFGFIAGGITRLSYPVPITYVGNCVAFGRSSATRSDLMGENGIVYAAKALGDTIKRLNGDGLDGAEYWIKDYKVLFESDIHIMVVGSPKIDFYRLDFGWGQPKKIEELSIDETRAISLCESRDFIGGIEIGIVLCKKKMDRFSTLFSEGLNKIALGQ